LVGMALLKRGQRLSVQPVMPQEWKVVLELAKTAGS
jgi:predicted RNA-binding protein with PUA-like domain